MRPDPETAQRTLDCKVKRVYRRLPLHVHSAGQERLAGTASGNPASQEAASGAAVRGNESSRDRLRIRLESELSSDAWTLLEAADCRRGTNVEDFLSGALAEAS